MIEKLHLNHEEKERFYANDCQKNRLDPIFSEKCLRRTAFVHEASSAFRDECTEEDKRKTRREKQFSKSATQKKQRQRNAMSVLYLIEPIVFIPVIIQEH